MPCECLNSHLQALCDWARYIHGSFCRDSTWLLLSIVQPNRSLGLVLSCWLSQQKALFMLTQPRFPFKPNKLWQWPLHGEDQMVGKTLNRHNFWFRTRIRYYYTFLESPRQACERGNPQSRLVPFSTSKNVFWRCFGHFLFLYDFFYQLVDLKGFQSWILFIL